MTISLNVCGICSQRNEKPFVCKKCLIRWKEMFGDSEKREVAETTATKIDTYILDFPANPLAKNT